MGALPLIFKEGDSWQGLGLDGSEAYTITGIENMEPRKVLQVKAVKLDGSEVNFEVIARLDTDVDVDYFENGGILPYVLRKILAETKS
jgi:aconitate hydratase